MRRTAPASLPRRLRPGPAGPARCRAVVRAFSSFPLGSGSGLQGPLTRGERRLSGLTLLRFEAIDREPALPADHGEDPFAPALHDGVHVEAALGLRRSLDLDELAFLALEAAGREAVDRSNAVVSRRHVYDRPDSVGGQERARLRAGRVVRGVVKLAHDTCSRRIRAVPLPPALRPAGVAAGQGEHSQGSPGGPLPRHSAALYAAQRGYGSVSVSSPEPTLAKPLL